jgi:hypothetical protein
MKHQKIMICFYCEKPIDRTLGWIGFGKESLHRECFRDVEAGKTHRAREINDSVNALFDRVARKDSIQ